MVKSCQTFTGSAIFENMETEDVDDLWTQLYGVGCTVRHVSVQFGRPTYPSILPNPLVIIIIIIIIT